MTEEFKCFNCGDKVLEGSKFYGEIRKCFSLVCFECVNHYIELQNEQGDEQ